MNMSLICKRVAFTNVSFAVVLSIFIGTRTFIHTGVVKLGARIKWRLVLVQLLSFYACGFEERCCYYCYSHCGVLKTSIAARETHLRATKPIKSARYLGTQKTDFMKEDQEKVFEDIRNTLESRTIGTYFIDSPGGAGKRAAALGSHPDLWSPRITSIYERTVKGVERELKVFLVYNYTLIYTKFSLLKK